MAYLAKDAAITLFGYLGLDREDVEYIDNTNNRGFLHETIGGEKCVIFVYPISHKADDSKNFFDTRDSGARERGVAWNYAINNGLKYFCVAVHDQVQKYNNYIFSLECDEQRIAEVAGTVNGVRSGSGTQVVIPNNYIPSKEFDRVLTKNNFFIAVVKKDFLGDYLDKYDNRPYMLNALPVETAINPDEQKEKFKSWLSSQKKANGDPYSSNTIDSYISNMGRGYNEFQKYKDYDSVFQIQDPDELKEYTDYLFNEPSFDDFNDRAGNKACSCGLAKYDEFLKANIELPDLRFKTGLESKFYRNRILFGAPGTGKSFTLNKERKELLGDDNDIDYERVTFHPDYSYANFVGTYKPVPCKDGDGKDAITYEYVPGPFMRIYVEALKNGRTDDVKPFLLIIEEINRANVAAVFGDIFQLLDRDDDEVSEYPIQASEDIKKYLMKELEVSEEQCKKIRIPDNMFIWATMNSADQGVFPMDTAFKRRWDFTYLGIDDSEKDLVGKTVVLGKEPTKHRVEWNKLRKAINKFLAKNKVNEDKQLGPYFIPKKIVVPENGNEINREVFINTFKNKVLMYLFEDAAKQKRPTLFEGCFDNSSRYSEICKDFEIKGIGIFNSEIQNATEPTDLPNVVEGNTVEESEE